MTDSQLANNYTAFHLSLFHKFPGSHELQPRGPQWCPSSKSLLLHEIVLTTTLVKENEQVNHVVSMSPSVKRVAASLYLVLPKAKLLGAQFLIIRVGRERKDKEKDVDTHANVMIIDLHSRVVMWFEPYGTNNEDYPIEPVREVFQNLVSRFNDNILSNTTINKKNEKDHKDVKDMKDMNDGKTTKNTLQFSLETNIEMKIPEGWGQSKTEDDFCEFWCFLFMISVMGGRRNDFIECVHKRPRESLIKWIEKKLMNRQKLMDVLKNKSLPMSMS